MTTHETVIASFVHCREIFGCKNPGRALLFQDGDLP